MGWQVAEPTWEDFDQTNSMLLFNILNIIRHCPSKIWIVNPLRVYRAATYYNGVAFGGVKNFEKVVGGLIK